MDWFMLSLGALGGFAVCWFLKDPLTKAVSGTEAFIQTLEAKIAAAKAAK